MLVMTSKGLYCRAGDFHIDPSGAVDNAVVTHAHSDHARRGSRQYYCAASGVGLVQVRLGKNIKITGVPYNQKFKIGQVDVSFHPAGHILGSAQVRLEYRGEVWVASGDYKRDGDPTCEPFEVVTCDVFVTEATFGTPSYAWNKEADLGKEIADWWNGNADKGINSVLFAYSLGKTQRVLGVLAPYARKPVYCGPQAKPLNECYLKQGVKLAPTICLSDVDPSQRLKGELIVVSQSFLNSPDAAVLGEDFETAFASGWMATGGQRYGAASGYDKGFVMSDHADWNDLLRTIRETKARRVYVQHRGHGALVRHLRGLGLQAYSDSELKPVDPRQMELF